MVPGTKSTCFRARLESCEKFVFVDNDHINGMIDPDHTHLTDLLLNEAELELQLKAHSITLGRQAPERELHLGCLNMQLHASFRSLSMGPLRC